MICMKSELTIALGCYEQVTLYGTPCGEYVESMHICEEGCSECIAGENFLQEIGVYWGDIMPADLHPKRDPKPIAIPPIGLVIILFIILFIIAIIMAWGGHSYYNTPLVWLTVICMYIVLFEFDDGYYDVVLATDEIVAIIHTNTR